MKENLINLHREELLTAGIRQNCPTLGVNMRAKIKPAANHRVFHIYTWLVVSRTEVGWDERKDWLLGGC